MDEFMIEQVRKRDRRTLGPWAADGAEHVLPYFEKRYPGDNRPREAIEAVRAWVRGEIRVGEARKAALAAHAAAREASDPAACAAARAAGHAAATAHVNTHAAAVPYYAAKAASAAASAQERDWHYQRLLELPEKTLAGQLCPHRRERAIRMLGA